MIIKEHNVATGEIVERDMDKEELAEFKKRQIESAEIAAKKAEAIAAKEALLTKLGISADEAKLLLS